MNRIIKIGKLFLAIALVFLLFTCKTADKETLSIYEEKYSLMKLPVAFKYRVSGVKSFIIAEYSVSVTDRIESVERNRIDVSNLEKHTTRKQFTLVDNNFRKIEAETLMIYKKEGFFEIIETANFYGRTSQSTFPFTISLVPNEESKVFFGQAKYLDNIIDIEGVAFFPDSYVPNRREIGFYLKKDEKIIGFISYDKKNTKVYVLPQLDENLRKTVILSLCFLITYERDSNFLIKRNLVKGEGY